MLGGISSKADLLKCLGLDQSALGKLQQILILWNRQKVK